MKHSNRKKIAALGLAFVVFSVALGVGMYYAGYYAAPSGCDARGKKDLSKDLLNAITADGISDYLKHLSSIPHLAGTAQDLEQAEWVRAKFLEFGLEQVDVIPYDVLLSYPDMELPNKVYLMDAAGEILYNTSGIQEPLQEPEEGSPLIAPNFNAYSGTGTAQGGLVYVSFGKDSDYDYVQSQGINVTGNIVLARYGGAFRANIVNIAEKRGAVGVILYSDPKDYAQDGRDNTYPDSWWMPGMAVQSGTVNLYNGDPLTPYYPSIESAYRINESSAILPKIPVQPIGYDEAEYLLRNLKEVNVAPADWQGGLNVTYYLGPELKQPGWKIKMDVRTSNKRATIHNTIGVIHGLEETDRYVMIGNHRDAWGLGALDPSSGTAAMLELAKAFGSLKKNRDWRPRRSLVFCSWGAEEYGLIGSYEWMEEHAKVLGARAVAYLNIDIAVEGNYSMRGKAAPLLRNLLLESSKKIPNPNPDEVDKGRPTVYDTWLHNNYDYDRPDEPYVSVLGSGSDFSGLMHIVGIPSVDIRYTYHERVPSYPLYHTLYETHYLLAEIVDKGFHHHRAVAQLWGEMALNLTESIVLPMDTAWYSSYLIEAFAEVKSKYNDRLEANGATLKYFEAAVDDFEKRAKNFAENTLNVLDHNDIYAVRRVNDQLMQLERQFIDPRGLPNRPEYNHIVFAPSARNSYASSSFAGLTDLLELVGNETAEQRPEEWSQIKQHLSVIAFYVQSAGKSLSNSF